MTIKDQNAVVIDDNQHSNINNFRTINGISLIGDGDLGVITDLTAIKSIHGRSITGPGDFEISKADIGLSNVDNTSDVNKPISDATQIALDLKACASSFASHINNAFNPHGVTAAHLELGNVTNESKTVMFDSPTFTGIPIGPTPLIGTDTNQLATTAFVKTEVSALVNSIPGILDTLNSLSNTLENNPNFATTVTNEIALKAPINSPTFTGTVSGISKSMIGLNNVDNTSDVNKPISDATQIALDLKACATHTHEVNDLTNLSGAVSTITTTNLIGSRVLVSDSTGKVAVSTATTTEIGYLSGVSGAIQTQINNHSNLKASDTYYGHAKIFYRDGNLYIYTI